MSAGKHCGVWQGERRVDAGRSARGVPTERMG